MAKQVKRTIGIYINGNEVENNIKSITASMSLLINQQKKMTIGSDEYIAHANKIRELRGVIEEHNASLKTTATNWEKLNAKMSNIGNSITGFKSALSLLDSVTSTFKDLAKEAAAMDDVYATVMKTTKLTREQVVELNEAFKKMDTRTSREQLNALAETAGRLGITSKEYLERVGLSAKEAAMQFVEAGDIINVSLGDVLGENAIRDIGKMADIFSHVQDDLKNMNLKEQMLAVANAVNELGKTSTANESYLVNFAGRLGGIATQAKISIQDILGFGSALDQNMQRVEMSATAIQKFIMKVMGEPAKFAKLAGLEVKEFSKLLETDANAAIKTVIRSLGDKGGFQQLIPIFKDMGLDGARAVGVLSALATNMDKVDEAQRIANQAVIDGTSALNEYNIKNNNMQAELEKARKKFTDMRLELGEKLYPILINLTKTGTAGLKVVSAVSKFVSENKGLVTALAAAWGVYALALTRAKTAQLSTNIAQQAGNALMGFYKMNVLACSVAYNKFTGNTLRAEAAQKMLKATMASTPWGAILAAASALVIGIYKLATRTTEAQKAMQEFNKESAKAEAEAKFLFDALKKAETGTDEYKRILEKLKELYPDIINSMINEKGELQDIDIAYKNVIDSIRTKIALQIKEKTTQEAIAADIEKQKNNYDKIVANLKSQEISDKIADMFVEDLKKMVEAGEDFDVIMAKLRENYKNIDFEKNLKHIPFNSIMVKIGNIWGSALDTKKAVEDIDKSIDRILGKKIPKNEKKSDTDPNSTDETETEEEKAAAAQKEANKKYLKEKEAFYKTVADLREKENISRMEDFDKELYQTQKQYDELIEKAKKYKDGKLVSKLQDQKEDAEYDIVLKYIKKYQEEIDKIADKQKDLLAKGEDNSLLKAIAGSQKQWQDVIAEIDKTIKTLTELQSKTNDPQQKSNITEMINGLNAKRGEANTQMQTDTSAIIEKEIKRISDILRTEQQKQIDDIREKYDKEIEIVQAAIEKMRAEESEANAEKIDEAEELINRLRAKQQEELDAVTGKKKAGFFAQLMGLTDDDMKTTKKTAEKMLSQLQSFASKALEISNNFSQRKSNLEQTEFNKFSQVQDARMAKLQEEYDKGLIAKGEYDQKKAEIEAETAARELEMKKEQFKREKNAATIQATIDGVLAVAKTFASLGYPAGIIPAAIAAAATIAQIALIQSQPEPYAKGGYIKKEKIIRAGEQGDEWIASNTLLKNPETAPVIEALENYQKGNRNKFNALGFSVPSMSASREFASDYFQQRDTSSTAFHGDSLDESEMAKNIKKLTQYMSDPKNRQAVISRKMMTEFDSNESELRNLTNL